eukprot:GHVS01078564.1.p1 GENE.GHVS01078564.1~~GHVS01078564.1.p1  ORF type:complete len:353 (+),score=68.19 GHVS01078564.1:120-1178(+)
MGRNKSSTGRAVVYGDDSTEAFTGFHEDYLEEEEDSSCGDQQWCCQVRSHPAENWENEEESGRRRLLGGLQEEQDNQPSRGQHSCQRFCLACGQRIIDRLFCILAVITVGIGIVILVMDGSYLYSENYFIFMYITITLVGELCIWFCMCVLVLLLKLFVGEVYSAHANAMCGISLKVVQGLYYYVAVGMGCFLLFQNRHSWRYSNTSGEWQLMFATTPASSTEDGSHAAPAVPPVSLPLASFVYIVSVVVLFLLFILNSCGVIFGALGWLWHKVEMKLLGREEVAFLQPTGPVAYASIDQYRRALECMPDPLVHTTRQQHQLPPPQQQVPQQTPLPQQQQQEQQQQLPQQTP